MSVINPVHLTEPLPSFAANGDGSNDKVVIREAKAGGADENHETPNYVIHQRDWKLETFATHSRSGRRCSSRDDASITERY